MYAIYFIIGFFSGVCFLALMQALHHWSFTRSRPSLDELSQHVKGKLP